MKRKLGTKVTHEVRKAPSEAMIQGLSGAGLFHPAKKPANWSTLTKGPGKVSASARPSFIAADESHPAWLTAWSAT